MNSSRCISMFEEMTISAECFKIFRIIVASIVVAVMDVQDKMVVIVALFASKNTKAQQSSNITFDFIFIFRGKCA